MIKEVSVRATANIKNLAVLLAFPSESDSANTAIHHRRRGYKESERGRRDGEKKEEEKSKEKRSYQPQYRTHQT